MAGELAQRIGARIRQARLAANMKQGELAAKVGSDAVNNQRVSDWERGVHKPSESHMEQIAVALDRDVSWFYMGDDTEDDTPDLMGNLSPGDAPRLVRIEEKLDEILLRLAALELPAGFEQANGQGDGPQEQSA